MRLSTKTIQAKFALKSDRTKNIVKHIGWSMFYKVGSIICNFLIVPLTIAYLDTENYGIWLTLSAFINWFYFFDIGLGNGLRNKFTEARASGNIAMAKVYVSTAYFTTLGISIVLLVAFLIANRLIDWTIVFNTSAELQSELSILLPVIFTFFCVQLVFKLITTIYLASNRHSIQDKVQFLTQLASLIVIFLLTRLEVASLLLFGVVISILPVLLLGILNFTAFNSDFKAYRPRLSMWKVGSLNDIFNLGFKFLIAQLGAMILFTTDSYLIAKLFGPAEVVPYNIAFRYFSVVTILYSIVVAPYWSSFTEAFTMGEFAWIKQSVSDIQKMWFAVPLVLALMLLFSNWFYNFWVGDEVQVSLQLSAAVAIFIMIHTFSNVYNYFINGVGKIKLHMIMSVVTMLLNIPLSIFIAKYLGYGPIGVVVATCICLLLNICFMPWQYYKLVNGTARGIWNQ